MQRQLRISKRPASREEQRILDERPDLGPAHSIVLMCWRDLESERPSGFSGAGPIPWSRVMEWSRVRGAGEREALVIAEAVRFLDVRRSEQIASKETLK